MMFSDDMDIREQIRKTIEGASFTEKAAALNALVLMERAGMRK